MQTHELFEGFFIDVVVELCLHNVLVKIKPFKRPASFESILLKEFFNDNFRLAFFLDKGQNESNSVRHNVSVLQLRHFFGFVWNINFWLIVFIYRLNFTFLDLFFNFGLRMRQDDSLDLFRNSFRVRNGWKISLKLFGLLFLFALFF